MTASHPAPQKLKVFVSYSRSDLQFADQLVAALEGTGFIPTIDRVGIHGAERWKERLRQLIIEADTVIFVLSSDSVASDVCLWEVEEAVSLGKRLIPIICRPLEDEPVPSQLRDLNYIYFYPHPASPASGFGSGIARLITALSVDVDWIREHTRLGELASQWDGSGRQSDHLVRGSQLVSFQKWRDSRPPNAPELTQLQSNFISASEIAESEREDAERQYLLQMRAAQEEREKAIHKAELALAQAESEKKEKKGALRRVASRTIAAAVGATLAIIATGATGVAYLQYMKSELELKRNEDIVENTYINLGKLTNSYAEDMNDEKISPILRAENLFRSVDIMLSSLEKSIAGSSEMVLLIKGSRYLENSKLNQILGRSSPIADALAAKKIAEEQLQKRPNDDRFLALLAKSTLRVAINRLKLNEVPAALAAFENANKIYANFSVKDTKNRRHFYGYLDGLQGFGEGLRRKRQFVEMANIHEKRILLAEQLLSEEPDNGEFLRHLATGSFMAGEAYRFQLNNEFAKPKYERALKAFPKLMKVSGGHKSYKRQLGSAYLQLGFWYADQKNFVKALAHHEKAADLLEQVTEGAKPGSWKYLDYMIAIESVGFALSETGKSDEAVKWFEKALLIRQQHADARPEYGHQRALAITTEMLGEAWQRLDLPQKALTLFEDSLKIRAAALSEKENDTQRRRNLANTWKLIGEVRDDLGNCNKSRDAFATAKRQLKQAMDEYQAANNQPRKGWSELLSEIDNLYIQSNVSCAARTSE